MKTNLFKLLQLISLFAFASSFAQPPVRSLQIGDSCPDLTLSMVNYAKSTVRLSDFRGKAVILDFWATWCAPCVGSFPAMDSLQKNFPDQLVILPVTYEDKATVTYFFNNLAHVKKIHPGSVVNDQQLNALFPHATVPHYVWMDKKGIVRAITFPESVTLANVQTFLKGEPLNVPVRNDEKIPVTTSAANSLSTLLESKGAVEFGKLIARDSSITSLHLVSKYIPGHPGGASYGQKNWVSMSNSSIIALYAIAYGEEGIRFLGGWSRLQLVTRDSTRFTDNSGMGTSSLEYRTTWRPQPGHLYNYLLKIPLRDSAQKFAIMRKDLAELFPFVSAKIEKQNRTCWVLKQIPGNHSFQSLDTGHASVQRNPYYLICNKFPVQSFLMVLQLAYQNNSFPIMDETGYTGNLDLHLEAEIGNPKALNVELNKYGLALQQEDKPVEILVIKDLRDQ